MPILAQIGLSGVRISNHPKSLSAAAERFQKNHYLKLEGFLSPEALRFMQTKADAAGWKDFSDDGGSELENNPGPAIDSLLFFMNHPVLFQLIQSITGCAPIRSFVGRGYRLAAGTKDGMHWHDDCLDGRLVAVSINVSRARYKGGLLRIRKKKSPLETWPVPNQRAGDAVIFRVDEDLEHCVTPIEGRVPKTAFSGWFRSKGKFFDCF